MRPRPCLITRMHVLLCTTCYSHIYESSASMGSKSAQKMRSSTNSTSPPLVPPRHHIPACKRTLPPVSKPGLDFSALSQSEPEMDSILGCWSALALAISVRRLHCSLHQVIWWKHARAVKEAQGISLWSSPAILQSRILDQATNDSSGAKWGQTWRWQWYKATEPLHVNRNCLPSCPADFRGGRLVESSFWENWEMPLTYL